MLRGVDFDVERGSIFALLGSNGAGKTTVVKILSTLLKADAGTATRRRLRRRHAGGRGAGVHQPHRAVRRRGRDPHRPGEPRAGGPVATPEGRAGQIADDLLDRFQLTDAADRRVATYSGGMRRRLDIAMSLIGNPPVIFLDEPTTGLDPQSPHRGVEHRQGARRAGHHGAAHHAVPRRGRAARRPDRDPARGPDHRQRHPRRAQAAPPAGHRSSTSRSSRPSRTCSSPSSALAPTSTPKDDHEHALLRRHRRPAGPVAAPHHAQPGHHHHDRDHADRLHAAVRLRVRRRDRDRVGPVRELPAARHPAHHDRARASPTPPTGSSWTCRAASSSRFQSMPIARSSRAVGARADLVGRQR